MIYLTVPLAFGLGFIGHYIIKRILEKRNLVIKKRESEILIEEVRKEAERIRIEAELRARDIVEKTRTELERETREKQRELGKLEKRLLTREESLERKYESIEKKEAEFSRKEKEISEKDKRILEKERELDSIISQAKEKIEQIAGMTQEAAKRELINMIEGEAKLEAAKKLKQIEEELQEKAEDKAKSIIALAIGRYAGEYTTEKTSYTISLPNDEMKGRIIGREGRNIRSIEARTGVDVIIDDTPETVVISSLNPIRREVARLALEKLIEDGRIHPARIEEVVGEVEKEIEKEIQKAGEEAVFDIGAHDMHPELVKLVGKLKYRTSFSQNMLKHSLEVAFICGVLAGELELDVKTARRAGLLHDVGKSVDHEVEGSHVEIGEDLVRRYGEPPEVVTAVAKYHDPQPESTLAILVQAADAISAARPGARREMYEAYVKRIEDIEKIGSSFRGVEKCYAIQAGREVRVIVESDKVNDEEAVLLAHEISKRIEREVAYPGQIKVTVVRETRAVSYAT